MDLNDLFIIINYYHKRILCYIYLKQPRKTGMLLIIHALNVIAKPSVEGMA